MHKKRSLEYSIVDLDKEEEEEEEEEEVRLERSSTKKARLANEENIRPTNGRGSSAAAQNNRSLSIPNENNLSAGHKYEKYYKGSIVRMRLKNFVTYSEVTFEPGPNLNVVIGPNGTGKSTIVCALALGLCGKPDLLGRGKRMCDYVKYGCNDAVIEIELLSDTTTFSTMKVNVRIRKDNTTEYQLNNRRIEKKELAHRLKALNIQVDNLCHFLPQDKVCDFAALTDYDRLRETERAVGKIKLLKKHDKLCTLSVELKKAEVSLNDQKAHLKDLEDQNKLIEKDVLRFKERETILTKIKHLTLLRPWLIWDSERQKTVALKEEREKIAQELEEMKRAQEPLMNEIRALEKRSSEIDSKRNKISGELKQLDNERTKGDGSKFQKLSDKYDVLEKQLLDITNNKRDLEKKIEQCRVAISNLQEKLNAIDIARITEQLAAINSSLRDIDAQASSLQQQEIEFKENEATLNMELKRLNKRYQDIQDIKQQKLEEIRRTNRDVYQAYIWLENHRDSFEKEVYGPLCLEVTTETVYASYLEMAVANWLSMAFVFQSDKDRKFFEDEMKRNGLRVSTTLPRNLRVDNPMKSSELRSYGIKAWLNECIKAPPPVMAALCEISNINRSAVADKDIDAHDVFAATHEVVYDIFTPKDRMITKRSRYGNKDLSTSAMSVKNRPRFFGMNINESEKLTIEKQLIEKKQELRHLANQFSNVKKELEGFNSKKNSLYTQKGQLEKDKRDREGFIRAIDRKKKDIEDLINDSRAFDEDSIKAKMTQINRERIPIALRLTKLMQKLTDKTLSLDLLTIEKLQISQKMASLQNENFLYSQKLHAAEKALATKIREYEKKVEEVRELKRRAEEMAPMAEYKDIFQSLPRTLQEVEQELESQKARSDMMSSNSNPEVIRTYEARKEEIEKLKEDLVNEEAKTKSLKTQLEKLKKEWLDKLNHLVSRINKSFNKHFQRFGRGEVRLAENEDFNKYALQIWVSYRDNVELAPLDPNTQSGGERSVATMIFLLSLHHITKCPFRLVDEINQGMDPKNEEKVFQIMQRIACRPNCPQYFLITPKLLPQLNIVGKLTFLCICNGPWANSK